MPVTIDPMLCTLIKEPFTDPEWLFEIKWDGYRLISHVQKGKVRMNSRSGLDYTAKYPPLAKALKALKHDLILDGEAVVFNEHGHPDFDALQKYNGHNTPIVYCVFDLLWMDGHNLMSLPLIERKQILEELLSGNKVIRFSEHYPDGLELYEEMKKHNMEGMVAKRKKSKYIPGERGNNWLKIPTRKRQEFVIGGYAESDKGRSFRSLLFGAYNNKKEFEWIGRSGGGYKEKEMPDILKKLKSLEIDESPFINKVLDTKGATIHWVKPRLVANFEFATWTKSGRIRKPATFLGFRKDKKAEEVVREVPKETIFNGTDTDITATGGMDLTTTRGITATDGTDFTTTRRKEVKPKPAIKQSRKKQTDPDKESNQKETDKQDDSNWKRIDEQPMDDATLFDIGDCEVTLHNVEREIWKGIPKAALINYYHDVADYILPYIKNRPQSLLLKTINAGAPGFYIKDMKGRQPDCADIFTDQRKHKVKGKQSTIDYLVCNNEATLLWMVNLGCIDINPWNARTAHPDQPDYITIDLDPSDNDFNKVIETARASREYLNDLKLTSFVKTSGQTGMHIYVPCTGITFKQARAISENISESIHQLVPDITTTTISVTGRGNKLFIDPSQNDYADTLAAPYSLRPYHLPTVSTPLDWKEVKAGLKPEAFTIKTIEKRLSKKGDLWKDLLNEKIATANTRRLLKLI